jgi:BirA family biotin operon repressor/biotin-[acetyl-CoA-carboxylase] ligase
MPDFLDAAAILPSTFVRHVELHDTLPSTNDRAIELSASPDLATPALVAARLQSAGRGRGNHKWWAAEGALTFSLILDTAQWGITQRDWPRLSLTTAVALCDALASFVPSELLSIKWPNDVLLEGAKVSGVLIESAKSAGSAADRLVVGVGINVNNSRRNAPTNVQLGSIAMCDVAGDRCETQAVLLRFLLAFDHRIQQLPADGVRLAADWQRLCSTQGRMVEIDVDGRSKRGRCEGISEDGAILLSTPTGVEPIYSGSLMVLDN